MIEIDQIKKNSFQKNNQNLNLDLELKKYSSDQRLKLEEINDWLDDIKKNLLEKSPISLKIQIESFIRSEDHFSIDQTFELHLYIATQFVFFNYFFINFF